MVISARKIVGWRNFSPAAGRTRFPNHTELVFISPFIVPRQVQKHVQKAKLRKHPGAAVSRYRRTIHLHDEAVWSGLSARPRKAGRSDRQPAEEAEVRRIVVRWHDLPE